MRLSDLRGFRTTAYLSACPVSDLRRLERGRQKRNLTVSRRGDFMAGENVSSACFFIDDRNRLYAQARSCRTDLGTPELFGIQRQTNEPIVRCRLREESQRSL